MAHEPMTEEQWMQTDEYLGSGDWPAGDINERRPVIVMWGDPTETPSQAVARLNAEVAEVAARHDDCRRELYALQRQARQIPECRPHRQSIQQRTRGGIMTDEDLPSYRLNQPGVAANAGYFLDVIEQTYGWGLLGHFSCSEVTTLAELMVADRGEDAGLAVILFHMEGDEEADELRSHLAEWPGLAEEIRLRGHAKTVELLDEIEKGQS